MQLKLITLSINPNLLSNMLFICPSHHACFKINLSLTTDSHNQTYNQSGTAS